MDVRSELARITGLGYSVFPIVRKAKKPLTTNGLTDATTDMDVVDRWIKIHGDCNWAVAIPPEAIVVDVDTLDGGDANLWPRDQEMAASLMDCGAITITPKKGRHHWFGQNVPGVWRNTAGKLAPKVDTRGVGGYVLIPPSGTRSGDYFWLDGMELSCRPEDLPKPPEWLQKILDSNPGRVAPTGQSLSADLPPVECVITFTHDVETFVNTNPYWHRRAISLLYHCGGQYSHEIDEVLYFVRPGKDPRDGHGATWNHPASRHGVTKTTGVRLGYPRLTVFTPNWPPFEAANSYSTSAILKLLTPESEWRSLYCEMTQDHNDYWHAHDPDNFSGWSHPGDSEHEYTPSAGGPHLPEEIPLAEVKKNRGDGLPNNFPSAFMGGIRRNPHGIMPRVFDAIEQSEWMDQPLLRVSGALALMSAITGRKIISQCGLLSNIYLLNVAPTGEGKDVARKVISKILNMTEPPPSTLPKDGGPSKDAGKELARLRTMMNLPHSDTATLKALEENPNRLAVVDEFGAIMLAAKKSPTSHIHRLLIVATSLFTHGEGPYYPPRYAETSKNFEIDTPCLSIFGFTVSRSLGESLDSSSVEGGTVPRCLIFRGNAEAPEREGANLDFDSGPLALLCDDVRLWRNWEPCTSSGLMVWKVCSDKVELSQNDLRDVAECFPNDGEDDVPDADGISSAPELFTYFRKYWLGLKRHGQRTGQFEYLAYTRGLELAKKVAMLISADRVGPPPKNQQDRIAWENSATINWRDALAACSLVNYCLAEMADFVRFNTSDGPTSNAANQILEFFKNNRDQVITKTAVCLGVRKVDCKILRQKALVHLTETGQIKLSPCGKGYVLNDG